LLIADEPTTALDVTVQAEILRLMKELQAKRGTSILFITHDFGVVSQMADRLAVMQQGKIVEQGELEQVLHRPQHRYTRQLLDALPENLEKERHVAKKSISKVTGAEVSPRLPSTPGEPLIRLKGLQVYFPIKKGVFRHTVGHVKAVDDVDMEINPGEIVALVGESGCGKTTLGRAILSLIEPTAGEVAFVGQTISGLTGRAFRPYRRQMQIIFQDPMSSLNPRLTVASTLTEPMAVHGIGKSKDERIERAAQALANVGLEREHLWRYPHEFSGGQRQRIGIARALVLEPRFIVCDEVTSALDVSVQAEILRILLELRAQNDLTLLFITHNIAVVEFLSDRMAVMRAGKVVEYGDTANICHSPRHDYTRQLMNAVPRVAL
jgi:peptide/nickel transport system ATP-binding protein